MAMVVDGSEWKFDGLDSQQISASLENFLDRIQIALERSEKIWIGENLQTQAVYGDFDLWALRSPDSPITLPSEIWEELAAWLGRDCCYLDEDWPTNILEVVTEIDGIPVEENQDVAWAHHNVLAGRAVACLSLNKKSIHTTSSSSGSASVHWVSDEASVRFFWRSAIELEGDSHDTLCRIAPHAYPSLHFHTDVWTGLHRLSGGYLAHRFEVKRHFAIFDDHGNWAFTFPPPALSPSEPMGADPTLSPSNQVIERRFLGLNIDIAPEKPNVYLNSSCRQAREIDIDTKKLYCGWHAKLQPHQNRIHVHAPVKESNGKFIIAIIDEHLELP
ncbi:hypothetical protein [Pseudomonas corrugata]